MKRVVITGAGILCSNAKGREDFWQALKEGRTGDKPVTIFDAGQFEVKIAGEIENFDATLYMGPKGLRLLDRSTRLVCSAAKLAVKDSGLVVTEENTDMLGVSIGTTLGSLKSIAEFDEITLKEGPRAVNPALFPNTVINSPASQISIWTKIKGFNTTISTGFTSSLDAMSYAYDFIQWGRADAILAGGVEELCYHTFYGFYALKFLSGSRYPGEDQFINCPFDRRRNGVLFGEGAGVIVMESLEHAQARGARILGEIAGFGTSFDPFRINRYNPRAWGLKRAMNFAFENTGLEPEDIDLICANANSTPQADRVETQAIKDIFADQAYKVPVTAVKSMVGEGYSVSGAFSTIAGLGAIHDNFLPPTVNYKEPDPVCDLDYVPNVMRPATPRHIMINAFGPHGSNTCLILKRYEP